MILLQWDKNPMHPLVLSGKLSVVSLPTQWVWSSSQGGDGEDLSFSKACSGMSFMEIPQVLSTLREKDTAEKTWDHHSTQSCCARWGGAPGATSLHTQAVQCVQGGMGKIMMPILHALRKWLSVPIASERWRNHSGGIKSNSGNDSVIPKNFISLKIVTKSRLAWRLCF